MDNSFTNQKMSVVQSRNINNRTVFIKSEKAMTTGQLKQYLAKFGQVIEDFKQNDNKTDHYVLFCNTDSALQSSQEHPPSLFIQLLADKKKEHIQAVYITNLPLDVSERVIEKEFLRFGPISYVKLNKDVHGELNGYGYVSYSTMEGFLNAIQASEITIQEKVVRIKKAIPSLEIERVEKELPKIEITEGQKKRERLKRIKEKRISKRQEQKIKNLKFSRQIDSNMDIILDNRLRIGGRTIKKNIKKLKEKKVNIALGMKKFSEKLRKRQDEIFFKKPSEMKKRRDKRRLTIVSNTKKANKLHLPYKTGQSKLKNQNKTAATTTT